MDFAVRLLLPDQPRHLHQTASRQFAQICLALAREPDGMQNVEPLTEVQIGEFLTGSPGVLNRCGDSREIHRSFTVAARTGSRF
jgi:hypothetical protein